MHNSLILNNQERKAVSVLGGVYALRMMGLFIVLPVLATAASGYASSTPVLIGLALGIHGLTQAMFQLVLGFLSDKIGRQPVIIGGMLIFVAGSIVAAMADTVYGLIIGRAIQGSGAISAVVMAFASDLVAEQKRSKAMAIIGIGIGGAFILSLIIGAPMESAFGLRGIFLLSAASGVGAILMIMFAFRHLPKVNYSKTRRLSWDSISEVLHNRELLRLNVGVFVLHLVMTANFLFLPTWIEGGLSLGRSQHWLFYAPVLIGSFLLMLPLLIAAEKKRCVSTVLPLMVLLLSVSQLLLCFINTLAPFVIVIATVLFFGTFNYLEANLPALTTRFCSGDIKGTALGIFSQSQFLGIFAGGLLGGVLLSVVGHEGIYTFGTIATLLWAFLAWSMTEPPKQSQLPPTGGKKTGL